MYTFALGQWFADWPDAALFYDDRWPRALLGVVLGLGAAGVAVLAWSAWGAPELFRAARHPVMFLPGVLVAVLLVKWWFSDDARHLPLAVVAHLVAAAGAAMLVGISGVPRAEVSRWITCSGLVTLIATPALTRAWTLLAFYARLQRTEHSRALRARALRAATFEPGGELLVQIRDVTDEIVHLAVLDARGEHPAVAARELLPHAHRGFFLVQGATLVEEPIAAEGSYRDTTRGLRITACGRAEFIMHQNPEEAVASWTPPIVVASVMLVAHQAVLFGAAWLLARAGAL